MQIEIYRPPQGARSVLYVLDGQLYFNSAVEIVRANTPSTLVVGIFSSRRSYDLTLPAREEVLMEESVPGVYAYRPEDVGGLDDFLEIFRRDVMPQAGPYENQAIFGHSLGGLAVLHLLFQDPNCVRTYIAASPSIWWARRAVLAGEQRFGVQVRTAAARPRVLITMGSEEGSQPREFAPVLARQRMVENARELTSRLQSLQGAPGYEVADYAVFPDFSHGFSPWPALARAIEFAFQA